MATRGNRALPIDDVSARLKDSVAVGRNIVVSAPPGAGKTTRVPLIVHSATDQEIIVLEPRRLAARMAARHVAETMGEPLGGRCGYQVRFDSKVSARTRIRFMTEGLFLRRLRDDPDLVGVQVVIFDEIHERHLDTDLALALVRRLQRDRRPDLRILAMSATLDAEPVARFLDAEVLACEGRAFPVEIEHFDRPSDRELSRVIAQAVRSVVDDGLTGDVLVFLPGTREIRQCMVACRAIASTADLDLVALHGNLAADRQDAAVRPGPRRKIIFSTNVAESSVTVEGVVVVIDSGLARVPAHDPWSQIPTLELRKISRASAIQRAGRAGRLGPGRCVRLYTRLDHDRRPARDLPEIARLDLSGVLLELHVSGVANPTDLDWLDAPPIDSLRMAGELLGRLGALDRGGELTDTGRAMSRFPVHPRLARLIVESQRRGIPLLGAKIAALLAERPVRREVAGHRRAAAADVLADLADVEDVLIGARDTAERSGMERGACHVVERSWNQLAGLAGSRDWAEHPEEAACMALLVGFPDRVARVGGGSPGASGGRPLALAGGGLAELAPESVTTGELVVAVAAELRRDGQRATKTRVRSAAMIEPEWLLELFPDRIEEPTSIRFDDQRKRVEAIAEVRYDGLVLDASPLRRLPAEARTVLVQAARSADRSAWTDAARLAELEYRSKLLATLSPPFPVLDDSVVDDVLFQVASEASSFDDLRRMDIASHVRSRLSSEQLTALERMTPTHVRLPSGRSLPVHYEPDRAPWVESRLQDFFGMAKGPTIAGGRVPLVVHLLAPNRRAVQVTSDLAGFWTRHYEGIRRTLMRRYPKHDWPTDPLAARPAAHRARRSR